MGEIMFNETGKEITYQSFGCPSDKTPTRYICTPGNLRINQYNDFINVKACMIDDFISILQQIKDEMLKEGLIEEESKDDPN